MGHLTPRLARLMRRLTTTLSGHLTARLMAPVAGLMRHLIFDDALTPHSSRAAVPANAQSTPGHRGDAEERAGQLAGPPQGHQPDRSTDVKGWTRSAEAR